MNVIDKAKKEFEAFNQLYQDVHEQWRKTTTDELPEVISLCEKSISLTQNWVQKCTSHIQTLTPATPESFEWKPMLEEIRNRLRQFRTLLSYRQTDQPLLETADKIRENVEELLENHCYLPEV